MDKNSKQIKPMLCPVCGKFYFTELSEIDIEQLHMTPNTTQCNICGRVYDLEQVENPDLENESNKMSLNQYKKWYKEKIDKNPKWEYFQEFIGNPESHKCPVCGEYEFKDALTHDICPICGWEDDGMEINPYDEKGGPSKTFIEYKQAFLEKRKVNPKYKWAKDKKI